VWPSTIERPIVVGAQVAHATPTDVSFRCDIAIWMLDVAAAVTMINQYYLVKRAMSYWLELPDEPVVGDFAR
ncbi:hypothetical protein SB719_20120, partial [Pantoea sp. SIMBA_079]